MIFRIYSFYNFKKRKKRDDAQASINSLHEVQYSITKQNKTT
jgi:hypothetical protein